MAADLDELLSQIDMELYLDREGVDYRRAHGSRGPQLNVRECPSCGGDKYKVYLNAETGLGNCFHGDCGKTFNKFSFIRAHLGEPDNSVVVRHIKEVAREFGWRPARTVEREVIMDGSVNMPLSLELPIGSSNLTYLEDRGIDIDTARYFHLRYCHYGWFYYRDGSGREREMFFGGRVIIPVFDLDGTLVAFQGRDITGKAEKKYLFPPGLPGTSRFLYNGQNAVGARRIAIGEGAFDVMALKLATDAAVDLRDIAPVGTFGMHLSGGDPDGNDQMRRINDLVKAGLKEAIFVWDGEKTALVKAMGAALELRKTGLVTRVALLPAGKDPNEVTKEVLAQTLREAVVMTRELYVRWRLKNPYEITEKSVTV